MDELTGLNSKKDLEQLLNNQLINLSNYSSLILFDIDSLIAVNDLYGYQKADLYIQKLGKYLKEKFLNPNLCFRYTGEEFIVLITDSNNLENITKEILTNSIDKSCIIDVDYSNNKFYSVSACIVKNLNAINYDILKEKIDNSILAIHNKKEHIQNRKYKNQGVLVIIE